MKQPSTRFLGVTLLILAGCATITPDSRIAQNTALFNSWPPGIQSAVRSGAIGIRFTPDQVRMALGDPIKSAVASNGGAASEVWIYEYEGSVVGSTRAAGTGGGAVGDPYSQGMSDYQLEQEAAIAHLSGARRVNGMYLFYGPIARVVFVNGRVRHVEMPPR